MTYEEILVEAERRILNYAPLLGPPIICHPIDYEKILLTQVQFTSYRQRILAWEIFRHECRRYKLGKRGCPTARECLDRVL